MIQYFLSPISTYEAFLVKIGASGTGNLDLNDSAVYGRSNFFYEPTCKSGFTL